MTLASASSLFVNNAAKRQLELFIPESWQRLIPAVFKAVSEQMCYVQHKNPARMMKAVHFLCVGLKLLLNGKRI